MLLYKLRNRLGTRFSQNRFPGTRFSHGNRFFPDPGLNPSFGYANYLSHVFDCPRNGAQKCQQPTVERSTYLQKYKQLHQNIQLGTLSLCLYMYQERIYRGWQIW